MYRYHSGTSSSGKKGHGGRAYRPPAERRDPNTSPPPLKECSCLVEFKLSEYVETAPRGRQHASFGNRSSMERCKRTCRNMRTHLVVPGRNQCGSVSIVARSYREALPAADWLLGEIAVAIRDEESRRQGRVVELLAGRIILDVANNAMDEKVGNFCLKSYLDENQSCSDPYCLFRDFNGWCVFGCEFAATPSPMPGHDDQSKREEKELGDTNSGENQVGLTLQPNERGKMLTSHMLQICLDNVIFQIGSRADKLNFFENYDNSVAYVIGSSDLTSLLVDEIKSFARS